MSKEKFISKSLTHVGSTSQAANSLLDGIDLNKLSFALIYSDFKNDNSSLMREISSKIGGKPLIGCTTSGEIGSSGPLEGGLSFVACIDPDISAKAHMVRGAMSRPESAGRDIARAIKSDPVEDKEFKALIVHSPGFNVQDGGWEPSIFSELTKEFPKHTIIGGSAGDGLQFLGGQLFCGGTAIEDGVVALEISNSNKMITNLKHGYEPTGRKMRITKMKGNTVFELDGKKAIRVYADLLGIKEKELTKGLGILKLGGFMPKKFTSFGQKLGMTPQKMLDELPFYRHTLKNPFGIKHESTGDYYTVIPKVIADKGGIEFNNAPPQGAVIELMKRNETDFASALTKSIDENNEKIGQAASFHLVVECAGRRMILGNAWKSSYSSDSVGDSAICGFFSHGEQGGEVLTCNNYSVATLSFT